MGLYADIIAASKKEASTETLGMSGSQVELLVDAGFSRCRPARIGSTASSAILWAASSYHIMDDLGLDWRKNRFVTLSSVENTRRSYAARICFPSRYSGDFPAWAIARASDTIRRAAGMGYRPVRKFGIAQYRKVTDLPPAVGDVVFHRSQSGSLDGRPVRVMSVKSGMARVAYLEQLEAGDGVDPNYEFSIERYVPARVPHAVPYVLCHVGHVHGSNHGVTIPCDTMVLLHVGGGYLVVAAWDPKGVELTDGITQD